MKINVCVGSSCHLKGSYGVIEKLKELVATHNLDEKVELSASFCLGRCATGVSCMVDDEFLDNVNADNIEEIFISSLLPQLK